MASLVKVKETDSLKELLSLLAKSREKIVYLQIAAKSTIWQDKALRLLVRAGREIEKKLVVVSDSRVARIRAEGAGLSAISGDELQDIMKSPSRASLKKTDAKPPTKKAAKPTLAGTFREGFNNKNTNLGSWLGQDKRRGLMAASLAAAVLAGFLVSNFILAKAEVIVYTRSEVVSGDLDVVINKTYQLPDFETRTIRAIPVTKKISKTETFAATGRKDSGNRSEGFINLNSSQPSTLTLRAQTTYLEGPDGQRYRFKRDVTGLLPDVPKSVEVIAESGGSGSNLAAGIRLEVYNAAFGYRPNILYAVVAEGGLTGGSEGGTTVVSDSDLAKAQDQLKENILNEFRQQIAFSEGENYEVLNELVRFDNLETQASARAEEEKENFNFSLAAEVSALIFDRRDIVQIVENQIRPGLNVNQRFLGSNENEFIYSVRSWDFINAVAVLNLTYVAEIAPELNANDLKTLLAGRSPDEIQQILLKKPEIASVKIDLSPFWLKTTPKSSQRLEVKVEIER